MSRLPFPNTSTRAVPPVEAVIRWVCGDECGGAFLEFLEGKKLPAVEILEKRAAP